MSAEAPITPAEASTQESASHAGDGTPREPRPTPAAKVKLALQPVKEAAAALEAHCEKFSDRFDGLGRIKCARLVEGLARAGAQSSASAFAALGGGDFRFAPSQPWQRSAPITPEGVMLLLGPLKQAIVEIEGHCDKAPRGEFDDSTAQCRDLAKRLGTATADVFTVIALGLGMRGDLNFRARAE